MLQDKVLRLIIKLCTLVGNVALLTMRWCVQRNPDSKKRIDEAMADGLHTYVPSSEFINPILLKAAFDDHVEGFKSNPENCQADLNACLESLRGAAQVPEALVKMLGMLTASGYPAQEALLRVLANAVYLGINIQKRLERA